MRQFRKPIENKKKYTMRRFSSPNKRILSTLSTEAYTTQSNEIVLDATNH
jgi:hypothetical protein